jgi:Transposase, Mutator family
MRDWAAALVERARSEGVELTGDNGLLTALVREVLQTGLEVEMADHLGYERHDPAGRGSGNSRNGSHPKTVTTEVGKVELRVPRDRNSSFAPVTVRKGQRRLDGLTGNVISLDAKGMTTGDIQAHLAEIYGTEISRDTISRITDAVVEDLLAWQNRPLDRVYPVLLIDAIVVKIRDGQVANRPIYVAMGINLEEVPSKVPSWGTTPTARCDGNRRHRDHLHPSEVASTIRAMPITAFEIRSGASRVEAKVPYPVNYRRSPLARRTDHRPSAPGWPHSTPHPPALRGAWAADAVVCADEVPNTAGPGLDTARLDPGGHPPPHPAPPRSGAAAGRAAPVTTAGPFGRNSCNRRRDRRHPGTIGGQPRLQGRVGSSQRRIGRSGHSTRPAPVVSNRGSRRGRA